MHEERERDRHRVRVQAPDVGHVGCGGGRDVLPRVGVGVDVDARAGTPAGGPGAAETAARWAATSARRAAGAPSGARQPCSPPTRRRGDHGQPEPAARRVHRLLPRLAITWNVRGSPWTSGTRIAGEGQSSTEMGIITTATTPASSRESSLRAEARELAPIHPQAKNTRHPGQDRQFRVPRTSGRWRGCARSPAGTAPPPTDQPEHARRRTSPRPRRARREGQHVPVADRVDVAPQPPGPLGEVSPAATTARSPRRTRGTSPTAGPARAARWPNTRSSDANTGQSQVTSRLGLAGHRQALAVDVQRPAEDALEHRAVHQAGVGADVVGVARRGNGRAGAAAYSVRGVTIPSQMS